MSAGRNSKIANGVRNHLRHPEYLKRMRLDKPSMDGRFVYHGTSWYICEFNSWVFRNIKKTTSLSTQSQSLHSLFLLLLVMRKECCDLKGREDFEISERKQIENCQFVLWTFWSIPSASTTSTSPCHAYSSAVLGAICIAQHRSWILFRIKRQNCCFSRWWHERYLSLIIRRTLRSLMSFNLLLFV